MIVNNFLKIILFILLFISDGFSVINTTPLSALAEQQMYNNNTLESKRSSDGVSNVKELNITKKRTFSITPYFGLSFIKQTFSYKGGGLAFSMYGDLIKRQQTEFGVSFDTYYNINKTFAISIGLSFGFSNLFASSSKGVDYYFDVDHYRWVDDEYFGLVKEITGNNRFTIEPLMEAVIPFHFKIMFNKYISIEPYAFIGINIVKIKNEAQYNNDEDTMNIEFIDDEILGHVAIIHPDSTESKKTIGLSTGAGINMLFFKERVIVGAEYKYLENKAYDTKFMVDTFSLKFAYRFHLF